jgi:Anti-sigma-K factor rskA
MMRRILGTIGVVAVAATAGFVVAGLGDGTRTYQATVDQVRLQGASAELEVSDDGATLVAESLPEPRPGEAFQAWIKRPGVEAPEPSVLFLPRDGSATAAVPADGDVEEVLVTREPKDGSDEPSEAPVMTIPISEDAPEYQTGQDTTGERVLAWSPRPSTLELLQRSARI